MITCDYCGRVAHVKDLPAGRHWFEWISDVSRGDDAMVTLPTETGEIGTICFPCLETKVKDHPESKRDNGSNLA